MADRHDIITYQALLTAQPVIQEPQDARDYAFGSTATNNIDCDFEWDLTKVKRTVDLRQYVTEIEDQGRYGSCVGNAVCSSGEYTLSKFATFVDLSRLYVYYNARARSGSAVADVGCSIFGALAEATKLGIANEEIWPYSSEVNTKPDEASYSEGATRLVGRYERLGYTAYDEATQSQKSRNLEADIIVALDAGMPVLFGMSLLKQFFYIKGPLSTHASQYSPGKITINNPDYVGGHALLIVGYDLDTRQFTVENSWGTSWGDNGYFNTSFETILANCFDTFVIRKFAGYHFDIDNNNKTTRPQEPLLVDLLYYDKVMYSTGGVNSRSPNYVNVEVSSGTQPLQFSWASENFGFSFSPYQTGSAINVLAVWEPNETMRSETIRCYISDNSAIPNHTIVEVPITLHKGVKPSIPTQYDPDDLYRFFLIAFQAAPGRTYMSQLKEAADSGMTVKEIVNIFTTKHQFTDEYPVSMTTIEFATKLVNAVAGNSITAELKQEAISDFVNALDVGWTRGDIIYQVFTNLATMKEPRWLGLSKKLENQVTYARYFTESMMYGNTLNLETLRKVVQYVDENSNTLSGLKEAIIQWVS